MENASKALMIAGGVLISIIIIGLLIMGFNTIRQYPIEQEAVRKTQELAKFNAEYEAFNRDHLYGTEVITVIRKAISNNLKYDEYDKVYDINVKLTLNSDVEQYYIIYSPIMIEKKQEDGTITYVPSGSVTSNTVDTTYPFKKGEYYLIDNTKSDRLNKTLKDFFFTNAEERQEYRDTDVGEKKNVYNRIKSKYPQYFSTNISEDAKKFEYIVKLTGFTQFKRTIFKCTGVEYNVETGRIKLMSFEES